MANRWRPRYQFTKLEGAILLLGVGFLIITATTLGTVDRVARRFRK